MLNTMYTLVIEEPRSDLKSYLDSFEKIGQEYNLDSNGEEIDLWIESDSANTCFTFDSTTHELLTIETNATFYSE